MKSAARTSCGARTRAGTKCRRHPVPGRARCKLHGGDSVEAGPQHHRYKHGLWSRHWDDERKEIARLLASGEMTELQFAQEIAGLAAARMDMVMQDAKAGKVDASSREVTAIQSELRLASRGLLEHKSAIDAPETEEATQRVVLQIGPIRAAAKTTRAREE